MKKKRRPHAVHAEGSGPVHNQQQTKSVGVFDELCREKPNLPFINAFV